MTAIETGELLRVENLVKHFPLRPTFLGKSAGVVRAVDGVSFSVREGETLGLVGESGSGKSTTGRLLMRLLEPTSGTALFQGQDLFTRKGDDLKAMRRDMQIVFQDPYSSLNPRMTVGQILKEGMEPRGITSKTEREAEVTRLLELVGMRSYQRDRFPHEFSGGQRQRIGIARALAAGPRLLVADEPVSALDVSIQAQVLNLLLKLQSDLNLTMLFIAHDLTVVRHMSDRIAVMYLGKIVELAESRSLYIDPRHPYTRSLLAAIPIPDPDVVAPPVEANAGAGSQGEARGGCVYRSRCPFAQAVCSEEPPLREIAPGHASACHFAETLPEFSRTTG